MKVHANAPLGPKGREIMVLRVLEQGWSRTEAAEAAGVSERTCSKWVKRYRAEGEAGMRDRSSAPKSIPHRTPEELVEVVVLLRKLRMTGAEIAVCLSMALSTVSAVLQRVGLGKLSRLEPPEPARVPAAAVEERAEETEAVEETVEPGAAVFEPLTPRELELLRYLAEGYTNKEIARAMVLAEDTVKKGVQTLIAKLGATDRTHAVVLALRRRLIE
jgi:DNA-binding NarL/FixJ family response regulator